MTNVCKRLCGGVCGFQGRDYGLRAIFEISGVWRCEKVMQKVFAGRNEGEIFGRKLFVCTCVCMDTYVCVFL